MDISPTHPGASPTSHAGVYLQNLTACLAMLDRAALDNAIALVRTAWQAGYQIITLGNGGSAVTALHYITDWNKAVYLTHGKPFRGRSLLDNIGLITAYSNDLSYADVFSEQIANIARPNDLVVAISGSGNSENVVRAVEKANDMGCVTLGLCGFSGGRLKQAARHVVWAKVDDMQLSEDVHAVFGHMVMKSLCYPEQLIEAVRP